ncbi:transposase [Flammeovirga aprica]
MPPYSPHLNIIERLWKEMKQSQNSKGTSKC